jgi:hypothetical protein
MGGDWKTDSKRCCGGCANAIIIITFSSVKDKEILGMISSRKVGQPEKLLSN